MADNYLEYHHEEYEARKARWMARKKHLKVPTRQLMVRRPEDEAL